jgi:hypothetical protein
MSAFNRRRRDKYLAQRMMLADRASVAVVMAIIAWRLDRRPIRKRVARKMCVSMFLDPRV